jgi:hypothetical protein
MLLHRADSAQGNRKKQKAFPYFIGAGIGLQFVLRLFDIPPGSMSHAWTAAGMAGLLGSTTGGVLLGYGLWWVAFRKSQHTSPGNDSRYVVYCWQCRRAIEFSQAMRGYKKKCPSCGTRQTMPRHLDPSVIPLGTHGEDIGSL